MADKVKFNKTKGRGRARPKAVSPGGMVQFVAYQSKLETALSSGVASEHTHRSALERLINESFQGVTAKTSAEAKG